MLLLSRKYNESVVVGSPDARGRLLRVTVIEIGNGHVTLGFEANKEIPIHRSEVWEQICTDNGKARGRARSKWMPVRRNQEVIDGPAGQAVPADSLLINRKGRAAAAGKKRLM
jgi:carbon storage regulator CsrA